MIHFRGYKSISPEKTSNLWNSIIWAILIAITVTGIQWQRAVSKVTSEKTTAFSDSFNKERSPLLLVSNHRICQQIGQEYQEVYSFETQNFQINICRLKESFFYHRQSKINPSYTIFLPAELVYGGDYFQAVNGNTVYLVGRNADGYYSSVMQDNDKIIFEPELNYSSATAQNSSVSNLNNKEGNYQANTNSSDRVCTSDKNNLRSTLSDWQEFIGESPETVSKYALSNGYHFSYKDNSLSEAIVDTTNGLQVILNIETTTQTVNEICVNSATSEL